MALSDPVCSFALVSSFSSRIVVVIMSKNIREYKLIVVGGGGVGKSCLTIRFVENKWNDYWDPTIEDAYVKKCVIDNEEAILSVLDTAGQEEYAAMREQYMRPGEGFLLVYSITDRSSFEELEVFYEQILRVKDRDYFPMIVVGTKCDAEFDRQVPSSEGRALAARLRGRHIETSAKERINVDAAFIELVKLIKSYQKEQYQARLPGRQSMMPDRQQLAQDDYHGKKRGCGCIVA